MHYTLKIAYNLKELAFEQNVKNFFFSRFKRRLIKKNIVDKLNLKVLKYINETILMQRTKANKIYSFCFRIINHITFKIFSSCVIVVNALVLGLNNS
jgi:hypothetical protein